LASLSLLLLATRSSAQDFGDYADDNQGPGGGGYDDFAQDDNLYADYAQRQQVKAGGAAGYVRKINRMWAMHAAHVCIYIYS
jgi:hypothetical protein